MACAASSSFSRTAAASHAGLARGPQVPDPRDVAERRLRHAFRALGMRFSPFNVGRAACLVQGLTLAVARSPRSRIAAVATGCIARQDPRTVMAIFMPFAQCPGRWQPIMTSSRLEKW
jgi:hypothetical protein